MKLSRLTVIGMAVVGALFLAWVAFMVFVDSGGRKSGPVAVDPNHCPNCGRELPPAYQGTGECPYCAAAHPEDPSAGSIRGSAVSSAAVPIVLIGLFAILLTVNLVVVVRARKAADTPEVVYHTECPKCRRKLRYRESQAGRLAACPLCRRPIVFPRLERSADTPWTKMRRWLRLAPG
jgi:DNA-directed RNA polymerase subunit RPC12/RpoP